MSAPPVARESLRTGESIEERQVVRQVRTGSVMRVALGMSLSMTAIVVGGILALFVLAAASGAMETVNSLLGAVGLENVNYVAVLSGTALLLIFMSIAGTLAAGLSAALYNAVAAVVGGVEVVSRSRVRR